MPDATSAITVFIQRAIIKEKRGRYAGFVAGTSSKHKFLETLDHVLARHVDVKKAVGALNDSEWRKPGYLYASDGSFGKTLESLRAGYDNAPAEGGWLIVSQSAEAAIFRPEGRMDDELYFRL